jgi:hypothetical protein
MPWWLRLYYPEAGSGMLSVIGRAGDGAGAGWLVTGRCDRRCRRNVRFNVPNERL